MTMWCRLLRETASRSRLAQIRTKVTVPKASGTPRRRFRPKLPSTKFAALSAGFLDRIEMAVAPMQPPVNDDFQVDRDASDALTIRLSEKEFEIKVVSSKQQLHFTSPISGLRKYEWNPKSQRWEDETDSHDIEGLLTRDLMRFCSGIPRF